MKKNAFPLVLALIVGIAAGYLFRKASEGSGSDFTDPSSWSVVQKAAFKKFYEMNAMQFSGKVSRGPINNTLAKSMIADFIKENEASSLPLLTVANKKLKGFYIDKGSLNTALSAQGATGLSFYFARADGATTARTYTLVFVGANNRGTDIKPDITNSDGTKGENPAQDYIKPCPDHCGDF